MELSDTAGQGNRRSFQGTLHSDWEVLILQLAKNSVGRFKAPLEDPHATKNCYWRPEQRVRRGPRTARNLSP